MHSLIVGITESGKTTLCKKLAEKHIEQGYAVLVLTSVFDEWSKGCIVYDDQDEFLRVFWNSKKCFVFIDEGGTTVGRYNEAMDATATRGRHWGHSCYFSAQRATQISATVRGQCSQLFCFAQGTKDAEVLAEEFNNVELEKASDLRQGEFYLVRRFGHDGEKFCAKLDAFKY